MAAEVPGWSELIAGNYGRAVVTAHSYVISDFFYAILIFGALYLIYAKTENFTTTMIAGALISGGVQSAMPTQTFAMMNLAIIFGLTVVIYQIFKS